MGPFSRTDPHLILLLGICTHEMQDRLVNERPRFKRKHGIQVPLGAIIRP